MDSAKALGVENWLRTVAVRAAKKFVPQKELLKMRSVINLRAVGRRNPKISRRMAAIRERAVESESKPRFA